MQQVTVNDAPVRIYDQNGSPDVMTVNGTVDLSGTTTSVGGTIKPNAGGHIDVAVVDPVTTDHLGAKTAIGETPFDIAIALSPMGGSPPAPSAAISKLAGSVITDVNMTKAGGKFSTLGRIGNPGAVTTFTNYQGGVMDVYAAEMITANSAAIRNTTDDLPWAVGAIEQNGGNPVNPAQRLTVRDITVNDECFGRACPNSANETPGGVAW